MSACDQSLFVAASCGQFSWETENAIRGEERRGEGRGIIRIKGVSEVWREDGASVVLWAWPTHCAEPRHPKPSSAHVYTPEASQTVNLNDVGCPRAEEND